LRLKDGPSNALATIQNGFYMQAPFTYILEIGNIYLESKVPNLCYKSFWIFL